MNNILIVDLETGGLNPATDPVIEVGAILYSLNHGCTLESFSTLIHSTTNAAESINRIPAAALLGAPLSKEVWPRIFDMASAATAIVAHRAEFDYSFAPSEIQNARPWVCSKFDIQWPKQTREGGSLVNLALEHDLGVAYAHRALADCDLLARLFSRSRELGADLDAMLARAMRPKVEVVALVTYAENQKAKDAGFRWDPARKAWVRKIAIDDVAQLPFATKRAA